MACKKVFVLPTYDINDLKTDTQTAAAYVALLSAQEPAQFWKAAQQLKLTRPSDQNGYRMRLTLPATCNLLRDLSIVVVLERPNKGFDYLCSCPSIALRHPDCVVHRH